MVAGWRCSCEKSSAGLAICSWILIPQWMENLGAQQKEKSLCSACASLSVGEARAMPKLERGGAGRGEGARVGYMRLGF